jgi:hypothetical protein
MAAKSSGRWLRGLTYVFLGLAAAFTLMGGAGTSCAANNPAKYDSLIGLVPYQAIYKQFVITGLVAGIVQLVAMILLIRGKAGSLGLAITTTLSSLLINEIHIVASKTLGGVPQPVYMVFGLNLLALILLLICLIPAVGRYVNFEEGANNKKAAANGAAAMLIAAGLGVITAPLWGGSSHTIGGFNYANAWPIAMNLIGFGMIIAGAAILTLRWRASAQSQPLGERAG